MTFFFFNKISIEKYFMFCVHFYSPPGKNYGMSTLKICSLRLFIFPWYDTKLHFIMRLLFSSSGECKIPVHYHYPQVHCDPFRVFSINQIDKLSKLFIFSWTIWYGLFSLFNGIPNFVGYLMPEPCTIQLIAEGNKRVCTFPKGICPKVNIIAWLYLEFAVVQLFIHYATVSPQLLTVLHAKNTVKK